MGCAKGTTGPTGTGDVGGFRLVAFASDRGNASGQYDIYLWDADQLAFHPTTPLHSQASERHPSVSPDGRFIAYQVDRGGGAGDDIEVFDRRNVSIDALPQLNTADAESEPVFTGDGHRLCYTQGTTVRRIRVFD